VIFVPVHVNMLTISIFIPYSSTAFYADSKRVNWTRSLNSESAFLTKAKIRHFEVLSALVKYSRQFKQREKRLLKVVTVNLLLYKQLQH
jgi:hypothetical protein